MARFGPRMCGYSQLRAAITAFIVCVITLCWLRWRYHQAQGPVLLCALTIMAMPILGIRSLAGLAVIETTNRQSFVQLATDPAETQGRGVSATVIADGKRVRAIAFGAAAKSLVGGTAGSRFLVIATTKPWQGEVPVWAVSKHLAGKMTIREAQLIDHGSAPWQAARWIRGTIARGALGLPRQQRALFGGFVLGDDRGQDPAVADDFRASGLSHLLVVSGQNVAFVLAAAQPLFARFGLRSQATISVALIAAFALLTRFEPSVLRASMMAALVVVSRAAYRPQHSMQILSVAVVALLLIDPLLTWSIGFGLSVGATSGLALLSKPYEERLVSARVPRWLTRPLAATLAAQTGTYPLLLGLGGMSPVSVPANLLALPAAEPLMIWGVVIGVPAGLLGHRAATVLHCIDAVLIWWVAGVARVAAVATRAAPVPAWWPLIVGVSVWWLYRHRRSTSTGGVDTGFFYRRRNALMARAPVGLAVVLMLWISVRSFDRQRADFPGAGSGAEVAVANGKSSLWRSGSTTVLLVRPGLSGSALLQALRSAGVKSVMVIVLERPTNALWTSLAPVIHRYPPSAFLLCGANSSLGSTPVVGLGTEDVARVNQRDEPGILIRCKSGRAQVISAAGSASAAH